MNITERQHSPTKNKTKRIKYDKSTTKRAWTEFDNAKKCTIHNDDTDIVLNDIKIMTDEEDLCHICNSPILIMEDNLPACSGCGLVYDKTLDFSPEWALYGADNKQAVDPTRCGNPANPLLQHSSVGVKLMCGNKTSFEMKKIGRWVEWQSMPHNEKTLYDEFGYISIMASNAGITKAIIDDAFAVYKELSVQKMFRGENRDCIKASSIYIACNMNGCPRTPYEIGDMFNLDKTSTTAGCSMAVTMLNNISRNNGENDYILRLTTPSSFIERFCSKLGINTELSTLGCFIAKKVESNNFIEDNSPNSIACGIIMLMSQSCNLGITKKDIRDVSGVSEVTVTKCYKKLLDIKSNLIPQSIVNKYM